MKEGYYFIATIMIMILVYMIAHITRRHYKIVLPIAVLAISTFVILYNIKYSLFIYAVIVVSGCMFVLPLLILFIIGLKNIFLKIYSGFTRST